MAHRLPARELLRRRRQQAHAVGPVHARGDRLDLALERQVVGIEQAKRGALGAFDRVEDNAREIRRAGAAVGPAARDLRGHAPAAARLEHRLDLGIGVAGEVVECDDRRQPEEPDVLDVLGEIVTAAPHCRDVLHRQLGQRHAGVHLQRAHRGYDHGDRRHQSRRPTLDVEELLGAEVARESRLGHDDLAELEREARGDDGIAAVRDVAERPTVHECRRAFERLHEVRLDRVLHEHGHGAGRVQVGRRHRRAVARLRDDHPPCPRLEIDEIAGEAEDGHDLGGHGDLEAAFTRHAVGGTAEPEHDVAQGAIVHVDHALEQHAARVDAQAVALGEMVVEHRGQQVVRGADRVHVAGEVEVDVLHRRELGVAAARGAALHAEHGPQRRLAERDDRALAEPPQAVGEPDGRRGLSLAGRCRRHRGHQHEGAVGMISTPRDGIPRDLGLVAPVRLELVRLEPDGGADLLDRLERHRARDVEILLTHERSHLSR